MKNFLKVMVPAAVLGIVIAIFAPSLNFYVNGFAVVAVALAAGLVTWMVWFDIETAPRVPWPTTVSPPPRRSASEWALETLMSGAIRGSDHSLRELAQHFADVSEGRGNLSPELTDFIAAREHSSMPRINRRKLQSFLEEIVT